MLLPTKTLLTLLPFFLCARGQVSGSGTTTRYWDCCKPSCAWTGKATLLADSSPVQTCDISDNPLTNPNTASGCGSGGSAYQCSTESPWAVTDDLAYGYAAVNIEGGSEASWCCACYELTFTSGAVAGKNMVVQATNTGGDLGVNQFDISMPGGGVGIFNGCTTEWGAPSSGWGAQYGGISSRSDCGSFPDKLKDGCYWRFDWFMGCDNPTVDFKQVSCPAAITKNTGCVRADDASEPAPAAISGSAVVTSSSAVAAFSSSAVVETSSTQAAVVVTFSSATVVTSSSTPAPIVSSPAVVSSFADAVTSSVAFTTVSSAVINSTSSVASGDEGGDDVCEL